MASDTPMREPLRMFIVATGERGTDGVPEYRAFETLHEAKAYGRAIGAKEVVEMGVVPQPQGASDAEPPHA